jgi:protein-S-isoprenylcysteine O-methyltransferase Ste14
MKRTSAALGSFGWLVLAPGTVCGLVPWLITGWRQPADSTPGVDALGWFLVLAGAAGLGHAFVAFAWHGRGTPAPAAPTERLVVTGAYRYVRNPMYVAVEALVLGQVLVFASWGLFIYLALISIAQGAFVRIYEEPTLREVYGQAYDEFCENVPRWLPRVTPWQGTARRADDRTRPEGTAARPC